MRGKGFKDWSLIFPFEGKIKTWQRCKSISKSYLKQRHVIAKATPFWCTHMRLTKYLKCSILCHELLIITPESAKFWSKISILFFQCFSTLGQLIAFSLNSNIKKNKNKGIKIVIVLRMMEIYEPFHYKDDENRSCLLTQSGSTSRFPIRLFTSLSLNFPLIL